MKSLFLLICFSLLTFRADAREVTVYMHNLQTTKYLQTDQGNYIPHYVLQAEQSLTNNRISLLAGSGRETSKRRHIYKNGTLTLNNATVNFITAFYQYGQLVLENSHGTLFGEHFIANEIRFDLKQDTILSPRIMFSSDDRISGRVNFSVDLQSF